ncbi:hypothetical protein B1B04_07950 [Lysinibacillus sp. KCTC 33748]|uniref:DUF4179 domain-containing protein n=1 Tax=unclassified Lysinibacillus TaxID=2636778 RepID=UPI0009A7A35A|nr:MULTISPECIES: DUF4179 domain-containing protein [unclassified Lysinibacillus]OXS74819.1 hypothetical protein B1B04_07950 [Lysinibacillus sp. KCTC 33748]SKB57892.1 protein of unknown function [Lysinibacillus sp. AC-3]
MKKLFNENGTPPEFPRDEVRSAITKGIQQAEEQINMSQAPIQMKRKSIRKPLLYVASAAAAFCIMVGSAAYVSPTFASTLSQLPIVGSVFSNSGFLGLEQANEQGLTSSIGEKHTINGISVTIDEVLYDASNITVGLTIDSEKKLSDYYFGAGPDFTINGKNPEVTSGGYGEKALSSTVRTGIARFEVKDDMPDSFEMGLMLEGEEGEKFEFTVPVKKIADIIYVPINHQQQAEDIQLDVSKISFSPSGIALDYKATEKGTIDNAQVGASFIEFRITDQNGKEITSHSGGGEGHFDNGVWNFSSTKSFDPISDGVQKLTITPYLSLPSGGGGVEIDKDGVETEIPFDPSSLKEVKFQPFSVEVPKQTK